MPTRNCRRSRPPPSQFPRALVNRAGRPWTRAPLTESARHYGTVAWPRILGQFGPTVSEWTRIWANPAARTPRVRALPCLRLTHWRQSRDPQRLGARRRTPSLDLPLDAHCRSGGQWPRPFHARLALRVSVSDDDDRTAGAGCLRRLSGVRGLASPRHAQRARSSARRQLLTARPQ